VNSRRRLLFALGASGVLAPLPVFGQKTTRVWRVGFLSTVGPPTTKQEENIYGAFIQGMRELGYVAGKNLAVAWRYGDNQPERLARLAEELVALKVDVIVTRGTPAGQAAQRATSSIPIVIAATADPVGDGFARSLARPGGNITGLSTSAREVVPKHLELLVAALPKVSRIAVLHNPVNQAHPPMLRNLQDAARPSAVSILPFAASMPQEFDDAFAKMAKERAEALIVIIDAQFIQHRLQIAELTMKHKLPSIYANREYPEGGGLMSYGLNLAGNYHRAAAFVDKILKGAKPAELPFEQPTRFELVINLKTARALGLTIPQSILVRADRVIE
jgi:putative ABC transport system substrate-binding protein